MFKKQSSVDEIANAMERHLVDGVINKQAEKEEQLVKAANYLNAAAEIFDESGLSVHAELITAVLESLAAKKSKKNKKKDKPKAKSKPAPKTKAPSSEKMVKNLKEKGWVFDENGADDTNYVDDNCALCGDMSYTKDDLDEGIYHLSNPENKGHTSRFTGTRDKLNKHLSLVKEYGGFGNEWDIHGPYRSHDELERKHYPHHYKEDGSLKIYDESDANDAADPLDNQELMSMLDDFRTRSGDEDFEDEDLHNPDTFSEEAYHPSAKLRDFKLEDPEYSADFGEPADPLQEHHWNKPYPSPRIKHFDD